MTSFVFKGVGLALLAILSACSPSAGPSGIESGSPAAVTATPAPAATPDASAGSPAAVTATPAPAATPDASAAALCATFVQVGRISVEKDPAGDPEAWVRFAYTTTVTNELTCSYTITLLDSQGAVVRTIETEDQFQHQSCAAGVTPCQSESFHGYSSTPYQPGMTATISID